MSEAWIAGAFSDPAGHTPEQQAAVAVSNELVDDELDMGAPMYNFGVPASLKAWIDQVGRVGRTFTYPSYQGLVTGKRATVITVRGGADYGPSEAIVYLDAEVPYLSRSLASSASPMSRWSMPTTRRVPTRCARAAWRKLGPRSRSRRPADRQSGLCPWLQQPGADLVRAGARPGTFRRSILGGDVSTHTTSPDGCPVPLAALPRVVANQAGARNNATR